MLPAVLPQHHTRPYLGLRPARAVAQLRVITVRRSSSVDPFAQSSTTYTLPFVKSQVGETTIRDFTNIYHPYLEGADDRILSRVGGSRRINR